MSDPSTIKRTQWALILATLALIVAVIAMFLPRPYDRAAGQQSVSIFDSIRQTGTLRIGFEGYPPYTVQDPRNGSVTGYSVDLANIIAKDASWKTEWIKTGADTKIPDLKTGKFDVMVEPIFETIARAKEVTFTKPYAYFGFASGIVRKDDRRFPTFESLNKPGVRVVVRQGYTDESYAQARLPSATIRSMKVDDINLLFVEVISGNADIALADTSQAKDFAAAHKDQVDAIFTNPPPASVPAGFMVRQADLAFASFLNASLDYLESNGVLDSLDHKYNVSATRPKPQL